MKLLRIVSDLGQETARINAVFNDNLIIAPHSKIALINAMVNLADAYLQVNTTNDSLAFKTKAKAPERAVALPAGNFTPQGLATNLEQAMNKALTYDLDNPDSADMGFMWTTEISSENKLIIKFARSDVSELDMANLTNISLDKNIFYLLNYISRFSLKPKYYLSHFLLLLSQSVSC